MLRNSEKNFSLRDCLVSCDTAVGKPIRKLKFSCEKLGIHLEPIIGNKVVEFIEGFVF